MSRFVTKVNAFFCISSEEEWLNKAGKKGLLLCNLSLGKYTFRKQDPLPVAENEIPVQPRFRYLIDWLDSSPDTEENKAYIAQKKEDGWIYCGKKNCFAYFAIPVPADEAPAQPEENRTAGMYARIRRRFGKLTIFYSVILAFFLALIGYNIVWMIKFNDLGYTVPDSSVIYKIFRFLIGQNPAQWMLYLLIPLATIVAALTVTYLYEWLLWRQRARALTKKTEEPAL